MPDNISLGPQAGVNFSLDLLRAARFSHAIQPETALVPGINLSSDPNVTVRGTVSSSDGTLLTLQMELQERPRWVSLVLDMGVIDLRGPQWLGLVCAVQSPRSVTFKAVLRSSIDGGFVDSPFRKTVVAYAEPTTHLDALDVTLDRTVPRAPTKRELILLFETGTQELHLLNLGVFVA